MSASEAAKGTAATDQPATLIEMRNIVKRFPGVLALDRVNLEIRKGEILALIGENGAGKSTIIKILSGAYVPNEGEILVRGEATSISTPDQAQELGINTIHQESTLAPDLTAVQNIFLGRELRRKVLGPYVTILNERTMEQKAFSLAEKFDLERGDLDRPVEQLGALKQHIVEMLKALAFDAQLVIMDEPTAALTDHEREALFDHMRRLRDQGISILWVTHRLEELYGLADRASVLRDGQYVGTTEVNSADTAGLVRMMVGRDVESLGELSASQVSSTDVRAEASEVLRVENVSRAGVLKNISFTLRKGEILGIGGLAGAGRTELARAILGADKTDSGTIYLEGRPIKVRSPKDAFRQGIALVPEERKVQGIFADFSVARNISAAALWKVLRARFFIDKTRENSTARGYVDELGIRTPGIQQKIGLLSGGNQQKAILARCLFANPKVLILDEPTQGIDVGAKLEVYRLVNDYVRDGGAAIVISSELPELLGVSDRIMVLREGQKAGELEELKTGRTAKERAGNLEEEVMSLATGGE